MRIGSTGGGETRVTVNGKQAPGLDLRTLQVDISDLVKKGNNDIVVTVTRTLTNRMLQRDYKSKGSNWTDTFPTVQNYGMTGDVRIVPYTVAKVARG